MNKNEGFIDRTLRIILGLLLLAMVFIGPQTLWGYVGLIPLVTGVVGFCPLYKIFGLSSCPLKS
ncbi:MULTISPECIES: YgaP family membrane protein [Thalassomonas]|uniref:DUF2892 domain-containing protein n=1 Tax=Thalassomonas actiniarum TaxID=485447 RepID=A0AAE9YUF3_9GAMM|nr:MULTISPECIES: DUF2892 domain-containing protein [Thalassomonas]WDE01023.1 DUF2892 domain-containing protein [Thalassomonas actiniarum]